MIFACVWERELYKEEEEREQRGDKEGFLILEPRRGPLDHKVPAYHEGIQEGAVFLKESNSDLTSSPVSLFIKETIVSILINNVNYSALGVLV